MTISNGAWQGFFSYSPCYGIVLMCHNGFGLKCRFNALLARVSTSFFVRWTLKI